MFEDADPIEVGQPNIRHDDIKAFRCQKAQTLAAAFGQGYDAVVAFQDLLDVVPNVGIIVNGQDFGRFR